MNFAGKEFSEEFITALVWWLKGVGTSPLGGTPTRRRVPRPTPQIVLCASEGK
jgi:hypothetical protein